MSLNSASRVVVLGGTSGIGLAIAQAASEAGAAVVVASRNPDSVTAALKELPDNAVGHAVDASSTKSLRAFFHEIGQFDHLAYTAADTLISTPLEDYTPQSALTFFNLRVVYAFEAVRLAVPHLRPGGSITLTSGTAAFKGGPGWLLGCAAAGAIASSARSLAVELAPLRVNAVAPGVIRSPLWSGMTETEQQQMYADTGAALPLGRVGEVQDAAKAYIQLMDQDYATGVVSVIDGGTLLA
ncbi:SDR family oxidoreductase [Rhodococcus sp. JS3073]|uniref:SDR family oxidoreductase n=1 Tax=Rhodococcus sp. JS3073 TaxID=3002901 RepID=UPI002286B968|nr:SDR family oxidoreductase [Rhodococcus sp. JS3073]WAM14935.1 SDR family oxidoreductase [Rhodococcus sp. JS3073]